MLATLLLSSLSFYSCTGTGGAADSDGETYGSSVASGGAGGSSGSGSSAGGVTDSSGGEMSAWEIMQKMSAGHGDEVVAILTGGDTDPVAEERGTFEVILPASSMGLPAEGWVELEIAGDAYYKGKSFAGPDGNVRFTVPRQRVGAIITVSLTAYLPDGTEEGVPYISGSKTGPAEEGGSYSFTVPLVDLPRVTIDITGTKSSYGRTVEKDGVSYDVVEYTGSGLGMSVTNSDTEATMEIKLNDSTASESESLADGFNKIEVTAVKSEVLPPVTVRKNIYVVKALSEDDIDLAFPNGTETAADSGIWQYRYSQADNLKMTVTNNYGGDNVGEHSSIKVEVSTTVTNSDGTTTKSSAEYTDNSKVENKDLLDGSHSLTITLSKPNCEDVKLEKTITSAIKPIKVYVRDSATHIKFEESGTLTMRGSLYIGVNPHGQYAYAYGVVNTSGSCTWLEIRNLANGGNWNGDVTEQGAVDRTGDVYIRNKDDKLCYKTEDLHRANGNPFKGIIKVDFVPNLKSTQYDLWVNVTNDTPQRVGNGANSIHEIKLGLDDGY
ncbi:MAG: hypothetical protein II837_16450 [Treponema sp.]|nr:hypothetical protein [Treponema sp.]